VTMRPFGRAVLWRAATAKLWSRQTVLSAAEESTKSTVRRRDQTLTSREGHSIIQGDTHRLTTVGVAIFEKLNLYGIDRCNRQNLAGYGNEDRSDQYLFPRRMLRRNNMVSGIKIKPVRVS